MNFQRLYQNSDPITVREAAAIDRLYETGNASDSELYLLISSDHDMTYLHHRADQIRRKIYGTDVFVRGLIEFSNYCRNNCFYCGIRRDNSELSRYRLTIPEILSCCRTGYELGFRTFVFQGGEDLSYSCDQLCMLISSVKENYPDCAVTLSIGEKTTEEYQAYYRAGADRYLLRHETASPTHYKKLHPPEMSWENRIRCLYELREIGYQVGTGMMIGSPYQETEDLISDLRFFSHLHPDMIGMGPYLTHHNTPFADFPDGSMKKTLRMLSITRLMQPYALIPATTALGTIDPLGREYGLMAGADVVMPNLSPSAVRELYALYENKICTGEEAAECRGCLENRICLAGYRMVTDRGDVRRP